MAPCCHRDANVVLRFLQNDDARQSPASAKLFARAKSGQVRLAIPAVTVAEIFYILARVYKHTRVEAAVRLIPLIQSNALEAEHRKRILDALRRVTLANVDFGDAYLAATSVEQGDKVASFDTDLQFFPDLTTLVPQQAKDRPPSPIGESAQSPPTSARAILSGVRNHHIETARPAVSTPQPITRRLPLDAAPSIRIWCNLELFFSGPS